MQRRAGELRQARKGATVARNSVCRRVPGHFFYEIRCESMETGYQVIARRWRPQQFDEIVGQDHIVRTLRNAITGGRIAHSYLFVGPRGTGKTTSARLFAKALNCDKGPTVEPCGECGPCISIKDGNSMDVIEIDGASNNSVDQVRQLREDCQYAPSQGRYRIYIIDEVHMLSNAAFNALLKTLEEPPAHVKFIFATTESHKVLPTIVSRCQRFEFRPIANGVIAAKLQVIAASEKINVSAEAVEAIAHLANGGMRDAQSILDQMISFCGESIAGEDVLDVYGLASGERIESLARALAAADYEGVIASVEELSAEGRDLYRVLVDVQARLRSVLLEAIKKGGRSVRLGSDLTSEAIMRMLDVLHAAEQGVKSGLSDKVNFEMGLLRAIEAGRIRAIDTVIRDLAKMAESMPAAGGRAQGDPAEDVDGKAAQKKSTVPLPSSQTKAVQDQGKAKVSAVPGIEELVEKIPPSAREMLEKDFHGRFREVRKVDPHTLS